ncbi:hypothetical protein OHA72_10120 [Dactylosporangium sp. NBC_01737]|uniref:hypothetical protein n=1 Tax=Dactylosporangium sp. NBC_01737 TaxID=2975959 RepID=UPI002E166CFA|nr:hypothetical protein OHA72_10120 [Dactylosporangium sp. NBC_01737]
MRRTSWFRSRLLSLTVAVSMLSGCTLLDDEPPPGPPPAASREIRVFDFADAEWFDASVSRTVRLKDGTATRGDDDAIGPMEGGGSWKLEGTPQFADADGDGDEDAAAALRTSGGQSSNVFWYVWLWQDGTAQQLRRPIASTIRCSRPIEAVNAVTGGFEIHAFLFQFGRDNCAGGGAIPIVYVAGVRDGWPVRIRPQYGPIDTCDPHDLVVTLRPSGLVQLRVDSDERSPVVEPAGRYDSVLVNELAVSPYLTPQMRGEWVLALAVRGEERICGWAHVDQVL